MKKLIVRPPVVTFMGHVDHGKTSLLDAIRKSRVAAGEYGEITQHIGAYTVEHQGRATTFLDTPGHEAFTAMRARGAQVTDIVVLVVSVEDGLMPQTIEAINHCHDAGVPIIVALNKIDRGRDNVPRIKAQLSEHQVLDETLGGQTLFVETAATGGIGIDKLLEAIQLQAEIMELKADPTVPAEGVVIESSLVRGTGPNVTVVVRNGVIRKRQAVVAGEVSGRIRLIVDDSGQPLDEIGPGRAGRLIGLGGIPSPGVTFEVVTSEKDARLRAAANATREKEESEARPAITLEQFYQQLQSNEVKSLNVILRADVPGSLEAITESVNRPVSEEVNLKIVHAGIGSVNESDVVLAKASKSIIIGFNVGSDPAARVAAARDDVQIKVYRVIYELLEDVEKALTGLLAPEIRETITGRATVREVFTLSNGQLVLGSLVNDGRIVRGSRVRQLRGGEKLVDGAVSSLRRFKENVREVNAGYECGIGVDKVTEAKTGDVLETYVLEEISRAK